MIWIFPIVFIMVTCRATTQIFYVLPDGNSSNKSCPSYPCATLTQYLMGNGTMPVVSNVEYRMLPGEHYITTNMKMWGLVNFSFIGITDSHLLSVEFICRSKFAIAIMDSYNVTITNVVLNQCKGNLIGFHASLVLVECLNCRIMNVNFSMTSYGFACENLLGESYLSNINIKSKEEDACDTKVFISFMDTEINYKSIVTINQLVISGGHSDFCQHHTAVSLEMLQTKYSVIVKLYNSWFHNMDRSPLHILTEHGDTTILVKNCTFEHFQHVPMYHYEMIRAIISNMNTTLSFENCKFNLNINRGRHINIKVHPINSFCVNPTSISIVNCDFVSNRHGLVLSLIGDRACAPNVFFNGSINILNNELGRLMQIFDMTVYLNGVVAISGNRIYDSIMDFMSCYVIISNKVIFSSNICQQIFNLQLINYIILMQYTSIIFTGNALSHKLMTGITDEFVYPFCFFQYVTLTNRSNVLPTHYAVTFNNNLFLNKIIDFNNDNFIDNFIDSFLSHCKWLPTAAFYGANPGEINQQIIKIDGNNWTHHNRICYCFQNGTNNCNIDVLGPVYPGGTFHVNLCIPEAKNDYFVYVETHAAAALPNSACKIAHGSEYIYEIGNYSKRINFTIASESQKVCELFLISWPNTRKSTAFYVKLLPCPIGFTLQNGICDCDPLLPTDIKTCYIQQSVIRRPANIWITVHTTQLNDTEYLMSDCPLDYCLPYPSDVNLLDPDLQCQFSRTGVLCSQCQHHLSMVFGSSRCVQCTNVHILITLVILVAGVILVVLLYLLNLTVTNGTINGIIFYANIISINDSVFLANDDIFKPLRVFISFVNLNIGIDTCFYNGMDSYAKIWLQLFFPFYLIFIAVSVIISSRFSSRILQLTFTRSFPVLATVFLLSYCNILRITLTVLFFYSTITHMPSGHQYIVWSFGASVPLFGLKFTILFITCLISFLLLVFFVIILFYTKYLSKYRYFRVLLKAFQGSYKDMYCYWAAVDIILRSSFFILYAFQRKLQLILATMILVLFIGYYGYVHPNKNRLVHIQEILLLVNLITIHAMSYQDSYIIFSIVTNLMISLAFLQFFIIVLYHFLTYTCRCNVVIMLRIITDKLFNKGKHQT